MSEIATAATASLEGSPRSLVLLAIADDALVTGHRASHWTGVAPSIEEDLAFSTIAQDGVNHADIWYEVLLGDNHAADTRAAVDAFGLGRQPTGYRHAVVCERPPRDFAFTLARHWAYEHFDALRLDALARSSEPDIAAVATKLRHELRYHLEHADHWFARLAAGGDDAAERLRGALASVLPEALGLFEPAPDEDRAVGDGVMPTGHPGLMAPWLETVAPALEDAGFADLVPVEADMPPDDAAGGRSGRHTSDFVEDVWPEMTALYRAHPGARW